MMLKKHFEREIFNKRVHICEYFSVCVIQLKYF